jgi:hypothetical protein
LCPLHAHRNELLASSIQDDMSSSESEADELDRELLQASTAPTVATGPVGNIAGVVTAGAGATVVADVAGAASVTLTDRNTSATLEDTTAPIPESSSAETLDSMERATSALRQVRDVPSLLREDVVGAVPQQPHAPSNSEEDRQKQGADTDTKKPIMAEYAMSKYAQVDSRNAPDIEAQLDAMRELEEAKLQEEILQVEKRFHEHVHRLQEQFTKLVDDLMETLKTEVAKKKHAFEGTLRQKELFIRNSIFENDVFSENLSNKHNNSSWHREKWSVPTHNAELPPRHRLEMAQMMRDFGKESHYVSDISSDESDGSRQKRHQREGTSLGVAIRQNIDRKRAQGTYSLNKEAMRKLQGYVHTMRTLPFGSTRSSCTPSLKLLPSLWTRGICKQANPIGGELGSMYESDRDGTSSDDSDKDTDDHAIPRFDEGFEYDYRTNTNNGMTDAHKSNSPSRTDATATPSHASVDRKEYDDDGRMSTQSRHNRYNPPAASERVPKRHSRFYQPPGRIKTIVQTPEPSLSARYEPPLRTQRSQDPIQMTASSSNNARKPVSTQLLMRIMKAAKPTP